MLKNKNFIKFVSFFVVFLQVYATMQDQLKEERATVNGEKMMAHIKEIAQQLFLNVNLIYMHTHAHSLAYSWSDRIII